MKRSLLAALLSLTLLGSGCKKEQPAPTPNPAPTPAPKVEAKEEPKEDEHAEAEEAPGVDDDEVREIKEPKPAKKPANPEDLRPVTEEELKKFIVYQSKVTELTREALKELKERTGKIQKAGGLPQTMETAKLYEAFVNRKEEIDQKAEEASGLKTADAEHVRELVFDVINARKFAGAAELDKTLAQAKSALKNMNPEQRIEAEEDLKELEAQVKSLHNAGDARDRFGDKNVDLVLAHEAELAQVYEDTLETAAPK